MWDYLLNKLKNNALYTFHLWFLWPYTVCLLLRGSSVRSDAECQKKMYFEVIQPAIILLLQLLTMIFSGSLCFHLTALQQHVKI